jgi:two-component system phosphate regulon sensor histidine kinase PhoR
MFRSIRWRIALPYSILIIVAMGTLMFYLTTVVRERLLADLEAGLLVQAGITAESVRPLLIQEGPEPNRAVEEATQRLSELNQARVTIINAAGTVLGDSQRNPAQMDNHLERPEIQQAAQTGQGTTVRYSTTVDDELVYAAVRIMENDQIIGYARVAISLNQIDANINQLRRTILAATVVMAGLSLLMAFFIAERTARQVRRLTHVARRMASGDLDARLYQTSRDEVGQLTNAFNNMADELRERVLDLGDERGRLAAVLDNMADGVLITDHIGLVRLINPAAANILGVKEQDSIGRSFAEVARHHHLIELWQQGCNQGREQVTAVEMSRQNIFIQMIVTPLQAGEHQNCMVILQDLTRIHRLETVRRDFISNISHELRTPIASLKALVETLRVAAVDDPPAVQRFLDRAEQEVDALAQLVQELLELARIESGKVPLRLTATAVNEVILTPVERMQAQAERNNLALIIDIPADLPPVMADASRIQQVIGNLVHNAIKFTPEGGRVEVRARLDKGETAVIIAVIDTGVGIPAADLSRIFERFYKADRARSGGGTGLGLAISRHLVKAHGGQLEVKSKEGKGSTFYFSLPVANNSNADL